MKFRFIDAEKGNFPIGFMCRQFDVSRSGFYAFKRRPKSPRALDEEKLVQEVKAVHMESRGTYGGPRVHEALKRRGRATSRKRVARLMRENGLAARCKKRFRRTTDSNHTFPIAENVLGRNFVAAAPNEAWVTDITYVWTREGWLYVAAIVDLFSRMVVGWAMSEHIDRKLCLDALSMAVDARRPAQGLIHHSDRGSQYASSEYRRALKDHKMVCSMSRKADCWDNAVAESFWSTLKAEAIDGVDFPTRAAARQATFDFIEIFYNRQRIHSTIGYRTPAEHESLYTSARPAA